MSTLLTCIYSSHQIFNVLSVLNIIQSIILVLYLNIILLYKCIFSFKFYKCDWGMPILFECPEELHFNPVLQVCDWPWQAGCDSSWIGCPRPFPRCPTRYPGLLPHPFLCDRFYQCDWGTPRLQACPAGLYFNSRLKVCDWSYNSDCQNCWIRDKTIPNKTQFVIS